MASELLVGSCEVELRRRGRVIACEAFGSEPGAIAPALQRLLPQRPLVPISARLSADHARLMLLPWLPQLTRPERWSSLAAGRFEQIYGEPPDGWVLRVADDMPPRARVAAAIPQALLAALRAVAKVRAVRIRLLDALGRLLEREPRFTGCAAEVGPDNACLLMMWRGEVRRVRARRFDALEELGAALRAEWAAAQGPESGAPPGGVAVAMLGASRPVATQLSGAIGARRLLELA